MTLDDRLAEVFRDIFDDPEMQIHDAMTAQDVESWDSLMHIQLLFQVEHVFGVQFAGEEAADLADVGELKRLLRAKGAG